MKINLATITCLISLLVLSGCSSTPTKDANAVDEDSASTKGYQDDYDVSGEQLDADGSMIGGRFSDPSNPLSKQTIYFGYDNSQVQPKFIDVIAAHAQYLAKRHDLRLVLQGHADERGSREYNITLGEQRAKAVERIMQAQGTSSGRLGVISYGEEKPAASGMDEHSWQLNRRVEIIYKK